MVPTYVLLCAIICLILFLIDVAVVERRSIWQKDPLMWWQQHCSQLPLLSRLARRYLAYQISEAASERVFSVAQDILTSKRKGKILPSRAGRLTFLKANLGLQNNPLRIALEAEE